MKFLENPQTGQKIELPHAVWTDENVPIIVEKKGRYIGGEAWYSIDTKVKDRPITLKSEGKAKFWLPEKEIKLLQQWSNVEKLIMTLTVDSLSFNVKFRHRDGAFTSKPPLIQPAPVDAKHKDVEIYLETV